MLRCVKLIEDRRASGDSKKYKVASIRFHSAVERYSPGRRLELVRLALDTTKLDYQTAVASVGNIINVIVTGEGGVFGFLEITAGNGNCCALGAISHAIGNGARNISGIRTAGKRNHANERE